VKNHQFLRIFLLSSLILMVVQFGSAGSTDTTFVKASGTQLMLSGKPYYAIGANCYYLQNLAAYGDTAHLIEALQSARALGITTIRTWGFYDGDDTLDHAVIQYGAGKIHERGLRSLDYVIAKAKEYSMHLILPLVNNWEDYGGMNRYVEWLSELNPSTQKTVSPASQQIVYGAEERSYRVRVTSSLTHDDFYLNDTIKQWYKNYIQTILTRTNTITNIAYKEDPTILAWEVANEPRSSDPSGNSVLQWMDEISSFIKSLDNHHLVSSGEEGFDITTAGYTSLSAYNNQTWMFNGTAGTSFSKNISLPSIDLGSIHCYPSAWHLPSQSAVTWLKDHKTIAANVKKPLLYGELGSRQAPALLYKAVMNEIFYQNTAGVLFWQLIYPGRPDNDGYGFSCPSNQHICPSLAQYTYRFEQKRNGIISTPSSVRLYQNYPNPFNISTIIPYDMTSESYVTIEIFNQLGELIDVVVKNNEPAGYHEMIWSPNNLASGEYFIRLNTSGNKLVRKVVLMK